ncbi:hypothetical protein A0H81_06288 [Grifola frondosa]|uniref:Uncharacterized protein n=1 Tax=Grifola frondosa TaxID=5627 RepID=A0A1C7MAT0_GRIFR|nr:hypothetical protein A0H81_06288 [Grifola frondosa]
MQPYSAQQTTSVGEQREQLQFDMHGKWALLEPDSTALSSVTSLGLVEEAAKTAGIQCELELSEAFISRVNEANKIFAWHVLLPVDSKGDLNDPSNNKVDVDGITAHQDAVVKAGVLHRDRPHRNMAIHVITHPQ